MKLKRKVLFTLLEIILATAILAFALGGLVLALHKNHMKANIAVNKTQAVMLAQEKIAQLHLLSPDEIPEQEAKAFELDPVFRYELSSSLDESEYGAYVKIKLKVFYPSDEVEGSSFVVESVIKAKVEDDEEGQKSPSSLTGAKN